MALSLVLGQPWAVGPADDLSANPLVAIYMTSDGRGLSLGCLQAGRYWADLCRCIGRPELADDPRFADHQSLLENHREVGTILTEVFASATLEEWRTRLEPFTGQWAVVQNTLEAATDPQTEANGYLQGYETADGVPVELVAAPVQFGGRPAVPRRAPEFNEHGDEILGGLGLDAEQILDLRVRGVVT
jgi:crotonobetainyl-CoA:carnitine CoA-transferase CaiB-like acyl-CoA transferase